MQRWATTNESPRAIWCMSNADSVGLPTIDEFYHMTNVNAMHIHHLTIPTSHSPIRGTTRSSICCIWGKRCKWANKVRSTWNLYTRRKKENEWVGCSSLRFNLVCSTLHISSHSDLAEYLSFFPCLTWQNAIHSVQAIKNLLISRTMNIDTSANKYSRLIVVISLCASSSTFCRAKNFCIEIISSKSIGQSCERKVWMIQDFVDVERIQFTSTNLLLRFFTILCDFDGDYDLCTESTKTRWTKPTKN